MFVPFYDCSDYLVSNTGQVFSKKRQKELKTFKNSKDI